jgi:hypothetical protein
MPTTVAARFDLASLTTKFHWTFFVRGQFVVERIMDTLTPAVACACANGVGGPANDCGACEGSGWVEGELSSVVQAKEATCSTVDT